SRPESSSGVGWRRALSIRWLRFAVIVGRRSSRLPDRYTIVLEPNEVDSVGVTCSEAPTWCELPAGTVAREVSVSAGDEDLARLALVIERQRRELEQARSAADVASVIAMARGAL